jgi:hypothetical protein
MAAFPLFVRSGGRKQCGEQTASQGVQPQHEDPGSFFIRRQFSESRIERAWFLLSAPERAQNNEATCKEREGSVERRFSLKTKGID